ncbi:hypothetical protein SMICM304S_08170 [Streptomyces microflavus]
MDRPRAVSSRATVPPAYPAPMTITSQGASSDASAAPEAAAATAEAMAVAPAALSRDLRPTPGEVPFAGVSTCGRMELLLDGADRG